MQLHLQQINILDISADVLICSANVCLNLTGGVGADIVARYGNEMQSELHQQIAERIPRCAKQGEVFAVYTKNLPYKVVLHAVAVDPMYHSTSEIIARTLENAFQLADEHEAKIIALTALASGFGDLTLDDFAKGLRPLLALEYKHIQTVTIPQIEDYRFKELCEAFPEAAVIA